MCTACVAQGVAYVGGAAGILRLMAARASSRRAIEVESGDPATTDGDDPVRRSALGAGR